MRKSRFIYERIVAIVQEEEQSGKSGEVTRKQVISRDV